MTVSEIIEKTGQSESAILREHLLLTALSKRSRYEAECALFEKKYGQTLDGFQKRVNAQCREEDFTQEDDLLDWEFVDAALKWWQTQIEKLHCALPHGGGL
jgi:hypothetical protein